MKVNSLPSSDLPAAANPHLLSLISGLIKPERGLIKINGRSLRESAANIGYMLQHDQLFEWRTIYHNVLLGLEIQHTLTARTREKAHELLDTYGLKQFRKFQTI